MTFGKKFNQIIDANNLPSSLTHLTFGSRFTQPIKSLPPSLVYLFFSFDYPHTITSFPSSLSQLHFMGLLRLELNQTFPSTLTHLSLPKNTLSKISFPPYLTHLTFCVSYKISNLKLPSSITHLDVNSIKNFCSLPSSITHLKIESSADIKSNLNSMLPNLTHLEIRVIEYLH